MPLNGIEKKNEKTYKAGGERKSLPPNLVGEEFEIFLVREGKTKPGLKRYATGSKVPPKLRRKRNGGGQAPKPDRGKTPN